MAGTIGTGRTFATKRPVRAAELGISVTAIHFGITGHPMLSLRRPSRAAGLAGLRKLRSDAAPATALNTRMPSHEKRIARIAGSGIGE